jgi:dihydrodipicolinate reductase
LNSEEQSQLRENHEIKTQSLEEKAEKRIDTVRSDLRLWASKELAQLEQSKDQEMVAIRAKHEQALDNMKEYYKNVIASNMSLIANLKVKIGNQETELLTFFPMTPE